MVGDHSSVTKSVLNDCVQSLLDLSYKTKCKLILCAFPYGSNLSEEHNKCINRMNLHLYNLTSCHSDVSFFDINKFIFNFKLTQDTMYLSHYLKRRVATLLAYNIQNANALLTLTNVSISTNKTVPFLN